MEQPEEVKKRIGFLPESPPLYGDMTVREYLSMDKIMDLLKIGDVGRRLIKNLSKGYQQRVSLAQALVGDPPVLILDEPTIGLDPKQIIEIRNLIKGLGKEYIGQSHLNSG